MYFPIQISEYNIYDIFHNSLDNIVIVIPWSSKKLDIRYKNSQFNIIVCPHKHTILYVLNDKTNYDSIIDLTIDGKNITTQVNKYPDLKNEIIMSTIVCNEDNFIKQWIQFHHNIGVSRFIIYDNYNINDSIFLENISDLKNVLKDFINDGTVILIKWTYPYRTVLSGISGQTTQQNHSLWAFKSSKYIGMFDVDEYVNIQTNHSNIDNFFDHVVQKNSINLNNVGSFRILNKFFYNPEALPTDGYNFFKIYNCNRITLTGHEKGFVIPKNVYVYSVHMIVLGKKMYTVSHDLIFFNHYYFLNKALRGRNETLFLDNSITKYINFLN